MSDLVERLRKQELSNSLPDDELCSGAADEIERLTKGWEGLEYEASAQIASLAAAVNTMHKEAIEQEKHIAKLEAELFTMRNVFHQQDAEIERLRAALKDIVAADHCIGGEPLEDKDE
jgi:chromosome segregation ATPase